MIYLKLSKEAKQSMNFERAISYLAVGVVEIN
jgi:hypothetical protein